MSTEAPIGRPVVAAGIDVISTGSQLPDNAVTMVGIGVCCAVVVASVAFVFRQNLVVRRLRAKQALLTPAAYRALHCNQASKGGSPGGHRHHRKHHRSSRDTGENGAPPSAAAGRAHMTDTPPPLPMPPPLTSDQSVVADGCQDLSDVEGAIDVDRFQFPVDDCHMSPVIGDRYRSSSAAALLMLHHSGQLSLLPSASSSSPPPPLTPLSLSDQRHRHRHRHSRHHQQQHQRSGMQPVSPAASRWSAGHGGGHLSVWSPGSAISRNGAMPLSIYQRSSVARRRLMMVHDQLTVENTIDMVDRVTCDADARAAAAAAAVAALGRFYSTPKQQQQQQHHQMLIQQQQQLRSFGSPVLPMASHRFKSLSTSRAMTSDYPAGVGSSGLMYPGNYFSSAAAAAAAVAELSADNNAELYADCFSPLEKRPPVEGRDSMTGDNVTDFALAVCGGSTSPTSTSSSSTLEDLGQHDNTSPSCAANGGSDGALKTARYVPPTIYHLAERRQLAQHKTTTSCAEDQRQVSASNASPSASNGLMPLKNDKSHRRRHAAPDTGGFLKRSSSLSSLSDIVAAAGDSDMLEFDDDEYDDYYRAVESAAAAGRLKPNASSENDSGGGQVPLLQDSKDSKIEIRDQAASIHSAATVVVSDFKTAVINSSS